MSWQPARDWFSIVGRDRCIPQHEPRPFRDIEFPADGHNHVTKTKQKTVSKFLFCVGIGGRLGTIECAQYALVAAVRNVKNQSAIAFGRIFWPEDKKIR